MAFRLKHLDLRQPVAPRPEVMREWTASIPAAYFLQLLELEKLRTIHQLRSSDASQPSQTSRILGELDGIDVAIKVFEKLGGKSGNEG